MNLVNTTLKIFIAKLLEALISFVAVVVFSRELGASPLGTYYPFIALLGIVSIPADFGIRSATEKRVSEGSEQSTYLGTAIALKLLPLLGMGLIILLADSVITQYLGSNLTIALVVALFTREAAYLGIFVLRGELRVGATAAVKVLQPLGWLIVGYAFFTQGFGINGLVYGYIIGTVAMIILAWSRVSIRPAWPDLNHARSLFAYGRYSVISSVGGYFYSWMDVAILSVFVAAGFASTRAEIGAYENAWRLSLIVLLFSNAIATSLFPQISQWSAEDAIEWVEDIIPKSILPSIVIVVPAFVGITVLARDLLRILFGPEFTVAWLVLIILTAEKILQSIHVIIGRSLQALDRPDLAAYATIVAIAVNFVLNVALIWQFGIVGAAIATTLSFAANTALHAYYLSRFVAIEFPYRGAAWCLVAATIMGGVVYAAQLFVVVNSVLSLLLVILLGIVTYLPVVLLYRPIRVDALPVIRSVLPLSLLQSK